MYVELTLELRNYCRAVVCIFEKQEVFLKEGVGTPILLQIQIIQKHHLLDRCTSTVIYLPCSKFVKSLLQVNEIHSLQSAVI